MICPVAVSSSVRLIGTTDTLYEVFPSNFHDNEILLEEVSFLYPSGADCREI